MDNMTMLGVALVCIGIVAVVYSLLKAKKPMQGLMKPIAILGIVGALVGWFGLGAQAGFEELISGTTTPPASYTPTTPATSYEYASFDITPAAGNTGLNISADLHTFSLAYKAWQGSYDTIQSTQNGTQKKAGINFTIMPVPWAGATTEDLATIYFEVTNPDQTVDVASTGSTYYMFTKSGSYRQVIWKTMGTNVVNYVEGSTSMELTGNATLWLHFTHNSDSLSRVESSYSPITIYITLHNGDNSWSEDYELDYFAISIEE